MQSKSMIASPLNYTGGKYKLLPQILPLFPDECNNFVDLFCGGCNVGINVNAQKIWFNDENEQLLNIYEVFKKRGYNSILKSIKSIIKKYDLSDVTLNGYEYYDCNSSDGVAKYNKDHFNELRKDLNERKKHDDYYYIMLYVVIIFAFNNQIRFNSKGEYNLPVGKRDFNKKMEQKLKDFIEALSRYDCEFSCRDFRDFDIAWTENDLVYADPPYLITTAGYNENEGWTNEDETALLEYLDDLDSKGVSFALSNVLESKGKENIILKEWCKKNDYKVIHLNYDYSNSNYHRKNKDSKSDEVLIVNY